MHKQKRAWDKVKGYFYILPAFIIIGVFVIYPVINSLQMSFYTDYNIFTHIGSGFGLDNYVKVMHDADFILALKNTIWYTAIVVPVSIIISLIIAVLLNSRIKGWRIFQTFYFLPYITNLIAMGFAFQFLFHSSYGVINYVIKAFGGDPIAWLNDPHYAMPALIIFGIWAGLAYKIVVLLAGLQNIDKGYYEAAQIDGATPFQLFRHITVPLVSNILFYLLIISVIGSFKVYIEVVALYSGDAGIANSAITIVYYVYDKFYGAHDYTIATAACVILFVITLLMTGVQQFFRKKLN